ncbi:MAG: hypothetical protein A2287_00260 [Candidatus Melainabacteria bacterium RIFOXYA12_FULL_32_12]|nr:MAG: hypothetical protein A2255_07910 [Candidatus Melainabacteria bacterium RIFOXYA2_FULL_32_9]OGI25646.1 MAG: hypothetical protein A2287_00260 [Candidatus Melainabacteria bacterium RIFOXYA12_FULL_32_12]
MLDLIKEKSINNVLRKYDLEPKHSQQVRKLSLLIFDKTQDFLHNFLDSERDLLEAGALLHDIGHSISSDEHNKYSYILIIKEKIEGFSPEEIEIIANIARYHKGKSPQKHHECFAKLPDKKSQDLIKKLSSIVRLADALDKSRKSVIEDLDCIYDSFSQVLYIFLKDSLSDLSPEIKAIKEKKNLFEKEFGVQVEFKVISIT